MIYFNKILTQLDELALGSLTNNQVEIKRELYNLLLNIPIEESYRIQSRNRKDVFEIIGEAQTNIPKELIDKIKIGIRSFFENYTTKTEVKLFNGIYYINPYSISNNTGRTIYDIAKDVLNGEVFQLSFNFNAERKITGRSEEALSKLSDALVDIAENAQAILKTKHAKSARMLCNTSLFAH